MPGIQLAEYVHDNDNTVAVSEHAGVRLLQSQGRNHHHVVKRIRASGHVQLPHDISAHVTLVTGLTELTLHRHSSKSYTHSTHKHTQTQATRTIRSDHIVDEHDKTRTASDTATDTAAPAPTLLASSRGSCSKRSSSSVLGGGDGVYNFTETIITPRTLRQLYGIPGGRKGGGRSFTEAKNDSYQSKNRCAMYVKICGHI